MSCNTFRQQLDQYLADSLSEDERGSWRSHLRDCGACRAWALDREPSLLLILASRREPEPERVDECVAAVAAMVRQQRLRARLRPRRRPWLAAAAALLVTVAAAGLWRSASSPGLDRVPADDIMAAEELSPQPEAPQIEVDMDGEGVRVYHLAVEDDEETTVAFIVNPALES